MPDESLQRFGGDWTEQKLGVLLEYLMAYATALKKTTFKLAYIDAFAGTGYRESRIDVDCEDFLFESLAEEEPQRFLDGSARIALRVEPAFDGYVFVEKDRDRVAELEQLKAEFPDLSSRILIREGDANQQIQQWARTINWRQWRAVLFLDPFGMQVDWATIEAVAKTGAIDMWLLFPHALGVNRMLMRDPSAMPPSWLERLDRVFGCREWFDAFYRAERSNGLFGQDAEMNKIATSEAIAAYFKSRLKEVFPKVAENPLLLKDSNGRPLFQFYFAAANPGRGGDIALNIAEHILGRIQNGSCIND